MEARGDADVQIVCYSWRKGAKDKTISQMIFLAVSLSITELTNSSGKAHFLWNRERVVLDLCSNFKWAKSGGYSRSTTRASDNST